MSRLLLVVLALLAPSLGQQLPHLRHLQNQQTQLQNQQPQLQNQQPQPQHQQAQPLHQPPSPQQQQQFQKYENVEPETITRNDRILLMYYKCIMDQGPCNRDGKLFKRVLPEALRSHCAFCTTKQTELVRKMMQAIKTKSEPRFEDLIAKFDGNGEYRETMLKFIFGTS